MTKRTFSIRLVRLATETVVVDVEATNPFAAIESALESTAGLKEDDWRKQDFDEHNYAIHAENIIDHQYIHETSVRPHEEIVWFRCDQKTQNSVKYCLLLADLSAGEGFFISQPWWCNLIDKRTQIDLCTDWSDSIECILSAEQNEDNEGGPVLEQEIENVIPFPPDKYMVEEG